MSEEYSLTSLIKRASVSAETEGESKYADLPPESQELYKKAEKLADQIEVLEKNAILGRMASPLMKRIMGTADDPGVLRRVKSFFLGSPAARIEQQKLQNELARLSAEEAAHRAVQESFSGPAMSMMLPESVSRGALGLSGGEMALLGAGTIIPATAMAIASQHQPPKIQITQLRPDREEGPSVA